MEKRMPAPSFSEVSSPQRNLLRQHSGTLLRSRVRLNSAENVEQSEARLPLHLEPLPSHPSNVVKIQRQMERFMSKGSLGRRMPSMLCLSVQIPHLPAHPEKLQLRLPQNKAELWSARQTRSKDVTPVCSPSRSKDSTPIPDSRGSHSRFNSPYIEPASPQDSIGVAAILTQMSTALKQSGQLTEEEFSRTDSAPKYHEFKFKLMRDDPLLKVKTYTGHKWRSDTVERWGNSGTRNFRPSSESL